MGFSKSKQSSKTDPTVQKIDPAQQKYLSQLYQSSQLPMYTSAANIGAMMPGALDAWTQMVNPSGSNPQLQAYMADVQQNLQNNLLPQIQGAANQAGQLGGSRGIGAMGSAVQASNRDIADMANRLYSDQMQRALGALSIGQDVGTMAQAPWMAQRDILGVPITLTSGGGSKSSGKGKGISL